MARLPTWPGHATEQADKLQWESLQSATFSVSPRGSQLSAATTEGVELQQRNDAEAVNRYAYR
jgi:hypothetical protein